MPLTDLQTGAMTIVDAIKHVGTLTADAVMKYAKAFVIKVTAGDVFTIPPGYITATYAADGDYEVF